MPTYKFHNKVTNEYWEDIMPIAQMSKLVEENPEIHTVPQAPMIVSGVSIKDKTDAGWKETLSKVAEKNPHTPIAERYGRTDDAKAVKTREIVKKHFGDGKAAPGF